MSRRNALLCWLLDGSQGAVPQALADLEALDDLGEDGLLAAVCLVQSGQVDRFAALVQRLDHGYVAAISRHCLFKGLQGDVQTTFLFFDALSRRAPACASLWIDLAVLQAVWGYHAASHRSMAMHGALTGLKIESAQLAFAEPEARTAPGSIRFLTGDATRFVRM